MIEIEFQKKNNRKIRIEIKKLCSLLHACKPRFETISKRDRVVVQFRPIEKR